MRRCPWCGLNNLYHDNDGGYTCLSCARQFTARLVPFRRLGQGVAREAVLLPHRHGWHLRRKVGA